MKKSFFMRTYNLNSYLMLSSLLTGFLGWLLDFLASTFDVTLPIALDLSQLNTYLALGSDCSYMVMTCLLSVLFVLVTVEMVRRIRFDSLFNYFKSHFHTCKFRHFLTQQEKAERVTTIDNQNMTTLNPINRHFNRYVRKSVVDIRKDNVTVLLKVPRTQQAQKLFKEIEDDIREEISNRNPDYYFSSPERKGSDLWFIGTKR